VNFRVQDPPLLMGEAQYTYSLDKNKGLDGDLKIGAWRHFGSFASADFASNGVPLASPLSNGMPQFLSGDAGVYGIFDQLVYHPDHTDPGTGVGVFARVSASPADRNLVDLYADAGVNVTGLVPGRPNDVFGAAAAYAHISPDYSALDQAQNALAGVAGPVRDYEAVLELTYQYQVIPGFTIQPDLQYVLHPAAGGANPFIATPQSVPNALVLGVRASVVY
jgi:porin